MTQLLELKDAAELRHWLGRLVQLAVVQSKGRTKGTEYFVVPDLLRKLEFKGSTTLRGIEKHRLRELLLQDLKIYGTSRIGPMHSRIGKEIPVRKLRRALQELATAGLVQTSGERKGRQYLLTKTPDKTLGEAQ
jgi:ATP-dependent DNA helicase RecG